MTFLTWVPHPIAGEAVERLRQVGDVALGYGSDATTYDTICGDVTGVVLRTARFGREQIAAAPRLRVIARHGVGFDTVDIQAADDHGVSVTITTGANAQAVAEHVFALLLAVARQVPMADRGVRQGDWDSARSLAVGMELSGRRLGLLGCGRIGRRVVSIAQGFGMRISVYDPEIDRPAADRLGVGSVGRDELLATSEVLSLHLPLTAETRWTLDRDSLARLRDGAVVINTSRGGLIDEDALADELTTGRLRGAGLDVAESEPVSPGDRLTTVPTVVLSPHVGGQTGDALRRVAMDAANSVIAAYRGDPLHDVVNAKA